MSELLGDIRRRIEPIIETRHTYLIEVNLRGERNSRILEVLVDTDAGVTLDECAEISRHISAVVDGENLIEGRYRLEVSSPGVYRPLKLHRQYKRSIGRQLKVTYHGDDGKKTTVGVLVDVNEGGIVLKFKDGQLMEIPFSIIVELLVQLEF